MRCGEEGKVCKTSWGELVTAVIEHIGHAIFKKGSNKINKHLTISKKKGIYIIDIEKKMLTHHGMLQSSY